MLDSIDIIYFRYGGFLSLKRLILKGMANGLRLVDHVGRKQRLLLPHLEDGRLPVHLE